MKKRRRGGKRIAVGVLQLALAVLLAVAYRFGLPALAATLGAIIFGTSGICYYFSGCRALCKAKHARESDMAALVLLFIISIPFGFFFFPYGMWLIPICAGLTFLAPLAPFARPGPANHGDLRRYPR